jgi:hypothetical protein
LRLILSLFRINVSVRHLADPITLLHEVPDIFLRAYWGSEFALQLAHVDILIGILCIAPDVAYQFSRGHINELAHPEAGGVRFIEGITVLAKIQPVLCGGVVEIDIDHRDPAVVLLLEAVFGLLEFSAQPLAKYLE